MPCMKDQDLILSPHFRLSELTLSQAAVRHGVGNTPNPEQLANLYVTAAMLEQVRALLGGKPIVISSGFRSAAVNSLVGGSLKSAHLLGLAADLTCPSFGTPQQVCKAIVASGLAFDQCIYEGTWVHLAAPAGCDAKAYAAINANSCRRQVLTARFTPGGPTRYVQGLVA
jgi:zinc D-Ala-D-Ala carboxypeptidase